MIYLHTKFHMPDSNGLFAAVIRTSDGYRFCLPWNWIL